jgi:hypothetical protein
MYQHIQDTVQLHESLEIIYVVDGWQVTLFEEDGQREVAKCWGETLAQAMMSMDIACEMGCFGAKRRRTQR